MMNEEKSYTTEDLLLFIDKLRREKQQLKEKVGELTQSLNEQMKLTNEENLDCSKYAVENKQLKDKLKGVQEERDYLFNKQSIENKYLTEENKQLKLDYELYKDNCVYRNYEVEIRDNTIKQLKEVIEEVRKYIEENPLYYYVYDEEELYPTISEEKARKEILQILDKAKENK